AAEVIRRSDRPHSLVLHDLRCKIRSLLLQLFTVHQHRDRDRQLQPDHHGADPGMAAGLRQRRGTPLMKVLRAAIRRGFDLAEAGLNKVFPAEWNPLLNLGALGFFFYWVITAS